MKKPGHRSVRYRAVPPHRIAGKSEPIRWQREQSRHRRILNLHLERP